MLIEYTVRFHSDGVTISQRLETSSASQDTQAPADQTSARQLQLAATASNPVVSIESGKGGGPVDQSGTGSGAPGANRPIVILGPIVIGPGTGPAPRADAPGQGDATPPDKDNK